DEAIAWNMPTPALPGAPESASKEEERAQDVHGDSDGTHIPWQQIQRRLTVYSLCLCAMGSDIGSERWRHRIDQQAECHIERQDSKEGLQRVRPAGRAKEEEGDKAQESSRNGASKEVPCLELRDRPVMIATSKSGRRSQAIEEQAQCPEQLIGARAGEVLVKDKDRREHGSDSGEQVAERGGR